MMKISLSTNNYLRLTGVVLFVLGLTLNSCSSDQLPEPMVAACEIDTPTYSLEVQPIMDATCAYSGCHLSNPSAPGNFDTYGGLQFYLDNNINTFRQRIIFQRDDPRLGMPPNDAPDDRPIDLTEEQLTILECWLDAGYPE